MSNPPYMVLGYTATYRLYISLCKPKQLFIIMWNLVFSTVTFICLISCHPLKCKCMYVTERKEKERELNVPRDIRRQEMTCSAFKAHNHWRKEVCGQLNSAPGNQELIPTRFTTSISVRACCLCLSFFLKGLCQNIIFRSEKSIMHVISVNDWHYSQEKG